MDIFKRFLQDETGSVAVEYSLFSLGLTLFSMQAGREIGHQIDAMFYKIKINLQRL